MAQQEFTLGKKNLRRSIPGVVGAALLIAASWALFGVQYVDAQQVLKHGVPGTYTFEDCDRVRGGEYCGGTFRSSDGRLNLALELKYAKDAKGLQAGDAFPARVYVGDSPDVPRNVAVRSDSEGRANVRERGISMAGIGVVGLMVAGFGLRSSLLPRGRPARRPVGLALGWGVAVGLLMFCVGGYLGTGA